MKYNVFFSQSENCQILSYLDQSVVVETIKVKIKHNTLHFALNRKNAKSYYNLSNQYELKLIKCKTTL